jgi:hypothetical protein
MELLLVCTYPKTCDFKDCICLQNGLKRIDVQNQAPRDYTAVLNCIQDNDEDKKEK